MGFLDSSTNNILIDAVLTDTGRQFLARNDGSFSIVKFACCDDGVDYSIIRKYGRTVGKEKIEKNTPVFEALTNPSYEMKNKLISVSNPNLLRMPSLSLTGEGVNSSNVVTLGRISQKTANLQVSQTIQNETSIDVELRDQTFVVEMHNLFLQIARTAPDNIDGNQRAVYVLTRSPTETALGGSTVNFTIGVKSLTEAQFTVYGATNNKSIISTYVKIYGVQSGAVKEFKVQINKTL